MIPHSQVEMQAKADHLYELSKREGLKIYSGQCKVLKIGKLCTNEVNSGNTQIEEADEFPHRKDGRQKGGTEADVKSRIGKARMAFFQPQKVWKARRVSVQKKIKLFIFKVKSVLMYRCETWITTKNMIIKTHVFVNTRLGKIFKVKWQD